MGKRAKHQGPGRADREGIILTLMDLFPTEDSARQWFEDVRWAAGRYCGHCGSLNTHPVKSGRPMPYRCSDCRKYFRSVTVLSATLWALRRPASAPLWLNRSRKEWTTILASTSRQRSTALSGSTRRSRRRLSQLSRAAGGAGAALQRR